MHIALFHNMCGRVSCCFCFVIVGMSALWKALFVAIVGVQVLDVEISIARNEHGVLMRKYVWQVWLCGLM